VSADSALAVSSDLSIPRFELTFRATRAGGPGGQHVNKASTRVELLWNVEQSRSLSGEQLARLRARLGSRIDSQGYVRVVASEHRSQTRNREEAETRLAAMVRKALAVPKARKKTRPGRSAVEARLHSKRLTSERKRQRRERGDD
jgi:ribosome-associated protein